MEGNFPVVFTIINCMFLTIARERRGERGLRKRWRRHLLWTKVVDISEWLSVFEGNCRNVGNPKFEISSVCKRAHCNFSISLII